MYQIFIAEDNGYDLRLLTKRLEQFSFSHNKPICTHPFIRGEDLLSAVNKHLPDMVLLDIDLPSISGLEVARQLRKHFPNLCIVFYTQYPHFAYDAFTLHANGFLSKETTYQDFDFHFNHYISQLPEKTNYTSTEISCFSFQENGAHYHVPYRNILYFEKYRNSITVVTTDESHVFYSTMKSLMSMLPLTQFALANQGIVVNLESIKRISATQVHLIDGTAHPVSASKHKDLMKAFVEFQSVHRK